MTQFFGALLFIAQLYFAYHAFTRKRYFWAIGIMFMPLFGLLGYVILKFWPEFQQSSTASQAGNKIETILYPAKELQHLKDMYESAPSFANKIALAEGLQKVGEFQQAVDLYETALAGFNNDDPALWQGLSHAYFQLQRYEDSVDAVKKLRKFRDSKKVNDFDLILARALEKLEKNEAALKEYEYLSERYVGEEARCRYALMLKRLGHEEEADAIFKEIINHSRLSPNHYKRHNQEWISTATKELKLR